MSKVLLDSSAVLAYLLDETGAEAVAAILENGEGLISSVNYAEIVSKLADYQMPAQAIQLALDNLGLEVVAFDVRHAFMAGELRRITKPLGLSLGDRACLGTARILGLPVLTGDQVWQQLAIDMEIRLLR